MIGTPSFDIIIKSFVFFSEKGDRKRKRVLSLCHHYRRHSRPLNKATVEAGGDGKNGSGSSSLFHSARSSCSNSVGGGAANRGSSNASLVRVRFGHIPKYSVQQQQQQSKARGQKSQGKEEEEEAFLQGGSGEEGGGGKAQD